MPGTRDKTKPESRNWLGNRYRCIAKRGKKILRLVVSPTDRRFQFALIIPLPGWTLFPAQAWAQTQGQNLAWYQAMASTEVRMRQIREIGLELEAHSGRVEIRWRI